MVYRNLHFSLIILHFIIPFFPYKPYKYAQEEMFIVLLIAFQNIAVWGQRKSTGPSDRKRNKPSLSNIKIQAQQVIHVFVIKRLFFLPHEADKSNLFKASKKSLCVTSQLYIASKLALKQRYGKARKETSY